MPRTWKAIGSCSPMTIGVFFRLIGPQPSPNCRPQSPHTQSRPRFVPRCPASPWGPRIVSSGRAQANGRDQSAPELSHGWAGTRLGCHGEQVARHQGSPPGHWALVRRAAPGQSWHSNDMGRAASECPSVCGCGACVHVYRRVRICVCVSLLHTHRSGPYGSGLETGPRDPMDTSHVLPGLVSSEGPVRDPRVSQSSGGSCAPNPRNTHLIPSSPSPMAHPSLSSFLCPSLACPPPPLPAPLPFAQLLSRTCCPRGRWDERTAASPPRTEKARRRRVAMSRSCQSPHSGKTRRSRVHTHTHTPPSPVQNVNPDLHSAPWRGFPRKQTLR